MVEITQEIARQEGLKFRLATVRSEQDKEYLKRQYRAGRITPLKNLTLELSFYSYWLADTNDAWYRSNGLTPVRPLNAAARATDSHAGSEIDLVATWNVNKHLQFQGGYGHFFAGQYLRDTGAADDANLVYLQAKVTF